MKNLKRIFLVFTVLVAALALVACKDKKIDLEQQVELNAAINFGGNKFISYYKDTPYEGLNGKTYTKGDLLPVWEEIGKNLNIKFVDKGFELGKSSTNAQFDDAKVDGFNGIDVINSTGVSITAERQHFVDLKPYLDDGKMPNLKRFLKDNPTYQMYMTAEDGGIYYTPYLDGNQELENGFLMRIDWTEKILNTTEAGDSTKAPGLANTTPFNPASLNTNITVATAGAKTRKVNINYEKNIITILKELGADATGAQYLEAFRTYMKNSRGTQYEKLADVFVGYDSGYLTDELIALMAVVKANPQLLRGIDNVAVYFPREARGSRVRNLFRGLEMYGVRGAVSKNNWLYIDKEGKLHDARFEESTIDALNRLNGLYNDQLILQNFDNAGNNKNWRDELLKDANGFLMFDYNATQTAQAIIDAAKTKDPNYRFEFILPPVVDWQGDGKYFHFTESVRMLKNEAWGITKQAAKDPVKLERAIYLFDYLYDPEEGANLHLFGPKEWRSTETVEYKGEQIPKFSEAAMEQMRTLAGGNMINYLRDYVGATQPIGHVRSLGLELQTVSDQGMAGYKRVSNAAEAKVLRLIGIYSTKDKWYQPVPNVFPLTTAQENLIKEVKQAFDTYWGDNVLYTIVKEGIKGDRRSAYNNLLVHNNKNWTQDFLDYYQEALDDLGK
ncbi:MAG: hypothetical protein ACOX56_00060 [Acholeplasmataceae bacterium]|jgi:hypothetical protein